MTAPGEITLSAADVGKCYRIYDRPQDRFWQGLWRGKKQFFHEFWALRKIHFEVRAGQSIGVIGRNGSGKSTLLQILAGTLQPTTGECRVRGTLAALLELGSGFNPEFTGRENVFLQGMVLGMSREEVRDKLEWILAFADIGEYVDQPVKTYSSGMFVRLAISIAFALRPEILLIDEALAVGDIFFQQKCMRHMQEELGYATRVLVTHNMQAVSSLTEHVLVLHQGCLAFAGPPNEAVEFYYRMQHEEESGTVEAPPPPSAAAAAAAAALPWQDVPSDKRSGAFGAVIERVAFCHVGGAPARVVNPGQEVQLHLLVQAPQPIDELIFGYIVNDGLANQIFGENNLASGRAPVSLPAAGLYHVLYQFAWPRLQPGDYTISPGIGRGADPVFHEVQCWAQNVIAVTALNPQNIYCFFNNDLTDFAVHPMQTD